MNIRTDLAVENFAAAGFESQGIHRKKRGKSFKITEITIDDDRHLSTVGKGKGIYITLETENLSRFSDCYQIMAEELSAELKKLIPDGEILVAGLGNKDITPDAIGPQTSFRVLATRHLRNELDAQEEDFLRNLRPVSVFAGGVLGQTGIETAEIVGALCREIKPDGIIVIDALACSDISRLGTTIQISNTGISPGSGVSNARKELSEKVFGIPVISVGIPTVVGMHTIVENMTGSRPDSRFPDMIVTPRDIDRLTERASELLAIGINLALQPTMSFDDVRGLF